MKDAILNEKTLIPVSVLAVLFGFSFWLSTLYTDVSHAKEDIASIKKDYSDKSTTDQMFREQVIKDLAVIKSKMGIKGE